MVAEQYSFLIGSHDSQLKHKDSGLGVFYVYKSAALRRKVTGGLNFKNMID